MSVRKGTLIAIGGSVSVAVLTAGVAISAQDKYALKVTNGLAFSEFRGYEDWPVIAISENGGKLAVIVGNPAMIDAYKQGAPGNGKPFPDGAKMAKIHWEPKTQQTYPGQPMVPGAQHDVDFMVKDSKRFADSGGWGWGAFEYDARPIHSGPPIQPTVRRRPTMQNAGSRAIRWCVTATTFSPSMARDRDQVARSRKVDQVD